MYHIIDDLLFAHAFHFPGVSGNSILSVDGDAIIYRFSIFMLYHTYYIVLLYCLTRCVRTYIIAGGIILTLNDRKGKQSLFVLI